MIKYSGETHRNKPEICCHVRVATLLYHRMYINVSHILMYINVSHILILVDMYSHHDHGAQVASAMAARATRICSQALDSLNAELLL